MQYNIVCIAKLCLKIQCVLQVFCLGGTLNLLMLFVYPVLCIIIENKLVSSHSKQDSGCGGNWAYNEVAK